MYTSSVQKANRNSIEFSLSTQTRRVVKSSQTKSLYDLAIEQCSVVYLYSFHSINLVLKSHCGLYTQRSNAISLERCLG